MVLSYNELFIIEYTLPPGGHSSFITKAVLGILLNCVCSCLRGRDRTHKGHLQPKTRLHTPNKVIKVIILILLIPLPPDMLIEKPVGIRQKCARVNDGRGGGERPCGGRCD